MFRKLSFKNVIIFFILITYILSSVAVFFMINNFFYNNIRQKFLEENHYSTKVAKELLEKENERLIASAKQITENDFVFNVFRRGEYLVYSRALSDKTYAMKSMPVNKLTLKLLANEIHRKIFGYHGERIQKEIEIYNNKLELVAHTGKKPNFDINKPPKYIVDVLGNGKSSNIEFGVFDKEGDVLVAKGLSLMNFYEQKYAVAVVKENINGELIGEIKKVINKEILIVQDNKVTNSTFYKGSDEIKNIMLEKKINETEAFNIKVNEKNSLFNFFAIKDYDQKTIAYIGVGFDSEQIEANYKKSIQKIALIQIFFLVLLLITMSFIFRLIFKPLKKLINLMEEIGNGNYEGKANIKFGKDLAVLGDGIEKLSEKVKNRELELKKTMEELNKSREKLLKSEKMVMLGELASSINHEVKNPLGAILTNVGLLKMEIEEIEASDAELLKDMKECIDAIDVSAKHAKRIIVNMLDFSRNDSVELGDVDLNNVISGVSLIMKKELQKDKITLKTEYEENVFIKGHQGSLTQVVLNFVMNARDAILEKGSDEERIIKVSSAKKGENVILEIEDNGAGISDENKQRMFEAFFTTKELGKGTGLGMSVSKTILDRHNAKIDFESTIGVGTKFKIEFTKN